MPVTRVMYSNAGPTASGGSVSRSAYRLFTVEDNFICVILYCIQVCYSVLTLEMLTSRYLLTLPGRNYYLQVLKAMVYIPKVSLYSILAIYRKKICVMCDTTLINLRTPLCQLIR